MKPWRDIFSVETWNGVVQAYQYGSLKSKSKTLGRHILSNWMSDSAGVKLPREIIELTQVIRNYHNIEKTELANIPDRVTQLKAINDLARRYLQRFRADHAHKEK